MTDVPITVQRVEKFTVVEFKTNSLMDAVELHNLSEALYKLVDEEDRRKLILDFEPIQYLSSQAIGIVINLHKKLTALPHSKLVLCSVGPKLMELLKITRLDKILTIKPSQKDAMKVFLD